MNCPKKKQRPAPFTFKVVDDNKVIDIGGVEKYMAVCGRCYEELRLKKYFK
jgi:thymidine kinase